MDAAAAGAKRLREAAFLVPTGDHHGSAVSIAGQRERFVSSMDDDLNTPQALAVLFDLSRDINRGRDQGRDFSDAQSLLRELAGVLGLTMAAQASRNPDAAPFIDMLVTLRTELRAAKQWTLADRVREGLTELGIEVKDGPSGSTWEAR